MDSWHLLSEKLPPQIRDLLVALPDGNGGYRKITANCSGGDHWFCAYTGHRLSIEPTHWREIPEDPKDAERKIIIPQNDEERWMMFVLAVGGSMPPDRLSDLHETFLKLRSCGISEMEQSE